MAKTACLVHSKEVVHNPVMNLGSLAVGRVYFFGK